MGTAKRKTTDSKTLFDPVRSEIQELKDLTLDVIVPMKKEAKKWVRWGNLQEAGSLRQEAQQLTDAANKLLDLSRHERIR